MKSMYHFKQSKTLRAFLTFMFLLAPLMWVNAQVSLNTSKTKLGVVIKKIQKQSKYHFFYDDNLADMYVEGINVKNVSVQDILNRLLKGKGVAYTIEDNTVYLKPQPKGKAQKKSGNVVKKLSGTVLDENGEPAIGATVQVKGTDTRVVTDLGGHYTIMTDDDDPVLQLSYLGYKTQDVAVKNRDVVNARLVVDTKVLNEVVVTALGIKRSEKSLSYNVQQVKADEITNNKDANFVNSLSGKVAGVNVNASSGGTGSISKVMMRGTKSIMQSSNALYIIDGVPMYTANKGGSTEFGSQGTTEPIADINPEDIESMSVLTGAAAAALYGSEAANGAVIITTKKGDKGRVQLSYTNNTEFSTPLVLPQFQNRYGTGSMLQPESTVMSWGRRLTGENNYNYQPKDDYFKTGLVEMNNISLSTGSAKNQTYASVASVNSKGIVPNNTYDRYNFTVRNTTSMLDDKMTLDFSASYIHQNDKNMTNQGMYNNPLVGAYLFPRGRDWDDITMYERYSPSRKIYTQYWPVGDAGMTMQNPYWINYRNLCTDKKDRFMLGTSLSYQVLSWLRASTQVRIDKTENKYQKRFYATTNTQLTELSDRGYYGITQTDNKQVYADFLLSVNKNFGEDWSLQANLGGSYTDTRMNSLEVSGPIADGSATFGSEPVGLTNFFAVQNLSASRSKRLQEGWHERTTSLYSSVELGYKSIYYLTLTGRNDWPSQLAGPNSNSKSFFYPSVGLSTVLSELIPNLNKNYLSYLKVRGSYASVGNPFSRYIANPRYEWNSSTNSWSTSTQYPIYNLKPERTESFEVGLTARFLKHFNLDFTYYNAKTKNQTFNPQLSVSGYSALYIQTGEVRNQGIEISLGYNNTWGNFSWGTGLTYSMNRNKILTLADNAINPATGERFSIDILNMGGLGTTRFLLKKGGSMGDIYSLTDMRRDDNGNIYVDANGKIATETISNPDKYIKLGSVLPKGNMAWRNNFKYGNFDMGFMITARFGGVVFSRTQAMFDYYGVSVSSADARDLGYVSINGGDKINPELWYNTIGGGTAVAQYYTYSATNVRLQEASIGYTIPRKLLAGVCDIRLSLVGRNLFMIYNKAPFDPESVASTDNFYQGIDYFIMPSLRNVGFSVNVKF